MNAVTYFSGMVFLPAFSVFPRGQFFIVERSLEKKNRYFMYAYYWLRKKVPHVAIVFSFQCTKKSNGEFSNFAELVQRRCSWQMARNINNVTIK
jgi:hypothetical protein